MSRRLGGVANQPSRCVIGRRLTEPHARDASCTHRHARHEIRHAPTRRRRARATRGGDARRVGVAASRPTNLDARRDLVPRARVRAPECALSGTAPRINARLAREGDARGRRDGRRDVRRFGTANGGAAASVANDLVDFLNDSWTAHHATEASVKLLEAAGYSKISESARVGGSEEKWKVLRDAKPKRVGGVRRGRGVRTG